MSAREINVNVTLKWIYDEYLWFIKVKTLKHNWKIKPSEGCFLFLWFASHHNQWFVLLIIMFLLSVKFLGNIQQYFKKLFVFLQI